MPRIAAALLVLGSLVACSPASPLGASTSAPSANPTEAAVATPAPPTPVPTIAVEPTAEPTPAPLPTAVPDTCPTSEILTPMTFWYAPEHCFGNDDVRILGWLDTPPPFGFGGPEVKPNWLFYPPQDALYFTLFERVPSDPEHVCEDCPGIFLHLPPDSEIVLEGPARWVIATGHRHDPAAERCHYVRPDDYVGELPDDAGPRESCGLSFVPVALEDAPAP